MKSSDNNEFEYLCRNTIEAAGKKGAEYADIRIESSTDTYIELRNDTVDLSSSGSNLGAGVRVAYRGAWGFASSNRVTRQSLGKTLDDAFELAHVTSRSSLRPLKMAELKAAVDRVPFKPKVDFTDVSVEEKCRDLLAINKNVVAHDKRVVGSVLSYTDSLRTVIFHSSEGTYVEMVLPDIEVNFNVTSREAGKSQWARSRECATMGYEFFKEYDIESLGKDVVKKSIDLLRGEKTPGGTFPIVMDPKAVGVFIHEAFGHANEADSVLQRRSFLHGLLGKRIGVSDLTVVTDPTIERAKGSYPYDSEGTPGRKTVLIENGVLVNYQHTRETAAQFEMEPTGNARAQDYSVKPIARMNNLYIRPGTWKLDEIIEDTKHGLLVEGSRGGMEDPERGGFQISAQNCYLIEKGEVRNPLRDVSLSGNTIEVFKAIDAIADNFYLYPGHCGKGEPGIMQGAGVTDGGPHIRVSNILVGGA